MEIFDEYKVFKDAFKELWGIVESQTKDPSRLRVHHRKIISEATIFLKEMKDNVEIDNLEEKFVDSWLDWFLHILGRELEANLILSFHYFENSYSKNPRGIVESFISIMVAIRALETCNSGFKKDTTVYNYFKRDMQSFSIYLKKILKTEDGEDKTNELFLLLNSIDTLATMENPEFNKYLKFLINSLRDLQPLFDKSFEISPGLLIYATELVYKLDLPITVKKIPLSLNGKNCAFLALMKLKNGEYLDLATIEHAKNPNSMHLWWIAQAWIKLAKFGGTITGILPFYQYIDVDMMFDLVWGDLREIISTPIAKNEFDGVLEFDDETIRNQLYEYFKDHPKLTTFSLSNLDIERDKPHGGGEISDFNVEFQISDERIWVAIPIKSGRESRGKSRKKMEQHFLYQFIRPLVEFGVKKTVVFPIILVKPTLNTHEFLSLIRSHLNLPILVIDIDIYSKFLKKNRLI